MGGFRIAPSRDNLTLTTATLRTSKKTYYFSISRPEMKKDEVWTGEPPAPLPDAQPETDSETRSLT